MNRFVRMGAMGAVLAAVLAVAGCGGGDASSSEPAAKGELSAPAQKAADVVAAASGSYDTFEPPGPAIDGVPALSGKVVYYVAAAVEVPLFNQIANSLTEALKTAGVQVRICDARGNPQDAASCIGQAVDAKAAAVIAGGFPEQYSPTAFKTVRDAGIPLLFTQVSPTASDDSTRVGYLTPDYFEMQALNANWVIADSDAKANVLVVKATDNRDLMAWVEEGALKAYQAGCPDCKVKVVDSNRAQVDKLPSLVTAALVSDPSIGYVQVAFDDRVQATLQGIQASGRTDVKVISQDGTLAVMQSLAKGNLLAAEVGFDSQAFAWYTADRTLRMMAGQEAEDRPFPIRRLFTRESAAGLTLSPEAGASGEWYGSADYRSGLAKLWGVSA